MKQLNHDMIFNEIMRRHEKIVRIEIAGYFENEMDRQDIFQEIAVHILEKLRESDSEGLSKWTSGGWIRTVTRNKCLDILRKNQKESKRSKDLLDNDAFERAATHSPYLEKDQFKPDKTWKDFSIEELLMELNDQDRQLIVLKFFKKLSIKEIDEITGKKNSSVYIERVLIKLKKLNGVDGFFDKFDGYNITD